ncbi:hypothetical protein [Candidatus Poriferisocius sp.]|uniref:hypothetical protein n=1 Tax=Candidatus Poriferisocius sp. TaxID=3101276 RepID=UPI003B024DBC
MAEWFRFPNVVALNPGGQHLAIFRNMLAVASLGANLVADAHIASLAIENQTALYSNDSDFYRFPGLRWRNPL